MDIYRMEREAQDRMTERLPLDFVMIGPLGSVNATWLDPFFGFITIDGHDGFFMTKQFANAFPPVDCVWPDESESQS